jgi:hypothetical protein
LLRVGWKVVDHFAGSGVVKFFASFVFDGVGVVLQVIHVLAQAGVFVFKLLDFVLELLLLIALSVPGGEPMTAVDYAPCKSKGEGYGKNSPGRSPALLQPMDGPLTERKRLDGRFLFFSEQIRVLHSASTAKV